MVIDVLSVKFNPRLREAYVNIVFVDLRFALEQDVEGRIWNKHHKIIERYRNILNQVRKLALKNQIAQKKKNSYPECFLLHIVPRGEWDEEARGAAQAADRIHQLHQAGLPLLSRLHSAPGLTLPCAGAGLGGPEVPSFQYVPWGFLVQVRTCG